MSPSLTHPLNLPSLFQPNVPSQPPGAFSMLNKRPTSTPTVQGPWASTESSVVTRFNEQGMSSQSIFPGRGSLHGGQYTLPTSLFNHGQGLVLTASRTRTEDDIVEFLGRTEAPASMEAWLGPASSRDQNFEANVTGFYSEYLHEFYQGQQVPLQVDQAAYVTQACASSPLNGTMASVSSGNPDGSVVLTLEEAEVMYKMSEALVLPLNEGDTHASFHMRLPVFQAIDIGFQMFCFHFIEVRKKKNDHQRNNGRLGRESSFGVLVRFLSEGTPEALELAIDASNLTTAIKLKGKGFAQALKTLPWVAWEQWTVHMLFLSDAPAFFTNIASYRTIISHVYHHTAQFLPGRYDPTLLEAIRQAVRTNNWSSQLLWDAFADSRGNRGHKVPGLTQETYRIDEEAAKLLLLEKGPAKDFSLEKIVDHFKLKPMNPDEDDLDHMGYDEGFEIWAGLAEMCLRITRGDTQSVSLETDPAFETAYEQFCYNKAPISTLDIPLFDFHNGRADRSKRKPQGKTLVDKQHNTDMSCSVETIANSVNSHSYKDVVAILCKSISLYPTFLTYLSSFLSTSRYLLLSFHLSTIDTQARDRLTDFQLSHMLLNRPKIRGDIFVKM